MLKKSIILFSSVALLLSPAAAYAKGSGGAGGQGGGKGGGQTGGSPAFVQERIQSKQGQNSAEKQNLESNTENEKTNEENQEETLVRKVGLERALENVKGTPAEEVIRYLFENRKWEEDLEEVDEEASEEIDEEESEEESEEEETDEDSSDEEEIDEETSEEVEETESEEENEEGSEEAEESTESDEEETVENHPLGKKRGLARALENVVGKPSEAVILALLTGERSVSEATRSISEGIQESDELDEEALEVIEGLKQYLDDAEETDLSETEFLEAYEELISIYEALNQTEKVIDSSEKLFSKARKNEKVKERLLATYKQTNQTELKSFVKGKKPEYDVQPVIVDGRTIVPLRAISEALDAEVEYHSETKTVTIVRGDNTIELVLNSPIARINGEEVFIDENSNNVTAAIVRDRTMVPLRFISEALHAKVEYDADTRTIFIDED